MDTDKFYLRIHIWWQWQLIIVKTTHLCGHDTQSANIVHTSWNFWNFIHTNVKRVRSSYVYNTIYLLHISHIYMRYSYNMHCLRRGTITNAQTHTSRRTLIKFIIFIGVWVHETTNVCIVCSSGMPTLFYTVTSIFRGNLSLPHSAIYHCNSFEVQWCRA